jgi:hypothetical protein
MFAGGQLSAPLYFNYRSHNKLSFVKIGIESFQDLFGLIQHLRQKPDGTVPIQILTINLCN